MSVRALEYAVRGSNTILRASYGRTMETPYDENLLVSSGLGAEVLTGTATPPQPGKRNQMELGIQQSLSHWIVLDVGRFNKRTDNAYDFNVLFNTPIFFPVTWDLGLGVRASDPTSNTEGPLQRDQPHEHRGAIQLPVHVQRHTLRHAARVPTAVGWAF